MRCTALWLFTCFALVGCKKDEPPDKAAEQAEEPAQARCLELPGAARTLLRASADGKTVYYLQFEPETPDQRDERFAKAAGTWKSSKAPQRYDLYSVDVAGGAPKLIAKDTGDYFKLAAGNLLFVREAPAERSYDQKSQLILVAADGKEKELTPKEGRVGAFHFAPDGKTIHYTFGENSFSSALYRIGVDGSGAKKLSEDSVYGIIGYRGEDVLVRGGFGTVEAVPAAGGERTPLAVNGVFDALPVGDGFVFVKAERDPEGGWRETGPLKFLSADGSSADIEGSTEPDRLVGSGKGSVYANRSADGKAELVATSGKGVTTVLTVEAGKFRSATSVPEGRAVLVQYDTDGSGVIGYDDEADLCIVPKGVDKLAAGRRHPLAKKAAFDKLAALAQGDLEGAKLSIGDYLDSAVAVFRAPGNGPTDAGALRTRAGELQAKVASATGDKSLGVRILYAGNDREAVAYFPRNSGGKLLLAGGEKDKALHDPSQSDLAMSPGSVWKYKEGEKVGSFHCKGELTNNAKTARDLNIRCALSTDLMGDSVMEEAPTPNPVPPGGKATYDFYVGAGYEGDNMLIYVLEGGKVVPYFNEVLDRRHRGGT